ncbi:hypothetical protein KM176_17965 [Pseudooceanicola sp. CBS1P-1]|uniref:Uncharacterized protein n=1 Tax=Pseudooceanicola albus TaxID=2692189 RepID=A0A6L7G6U7_9RHOB|nr:MULTISPECIES: hypothetical protein [Pseudooceanicola]MBT9385762.1 hypothetical protein [Pseudooceanicola endophyticus]MXN19994.1 hypothetical protein [Pseudooceanicola albus]
MSPVSPSPRPVRALRFVACGTGQAYRINGRLLTVYARDTEQAAREMMLGRDPRRWRVQILPPDPRLA